LTTNVHRFYVLAADENAPEETAPTSLASDDKSAKYCHVVAPTKAASPSTVQPLYVPSDARSGSQSQPVKGKQPHSEDRIGGPTPRGVLLRVLADVNIQRGTKVSQQLPLHVTWTHCRQCLTEQFTPRLEFFSPKDDAAAVLQNAIQMYTGAHVALRDVASHGKHMNTAGKGSAETHLFFLPKGENSLGYRCTAHFRSLLKGKPWPPQLPPTTVADRVAVNTRAAFVLKALDEHEFIYSKASFKAVEEVRRGRKKAGRDHPKSNAADCQHNAAGACAGGHPELAGPRLFGSGHQHNTPSPAASGVRKQLSEEVDTRVRSNNITGTVDATPCAVVPRQTALKRKHSMASLADGPDGKRAKVSTPPTMASHDEVSPTPAPITSEQLRDIPPSTFNGRHSKPGVEKGSNKPLGGKAKTSRVARLSKPRRNRVGAVALDGRHDKAGGTFLKQLLSQKLPSSRVAVTEDDAAAAETLVAFSEVGTCKYGQGKK
jgi:hypothetical protein